MTTCNILPNDDRFAPCTRDAGHTGPCAHHLADDRGDYEPDQCGSVGDPRDPTTPICVRKPGHTGEHRAMHLGTVAIGADGKVERLYSRAEVLCAARIAVGELDADCILMTLDATAKP